MTDISIQKLSRNQKEQIRYLYLANYEVTDIAEKLKIEAETVRFFVFGPDGTGNLASCLYQIKKGMTSTAISGFLVSKADVLERTAGRASNILDRALGKLELDVISGETVLSMAEMKMLAGILLDLDKIVRLETGKATENISHMGLTTAEAREMLANDPFAVALEAEFKEIDGGLPWLKGEE